MSKSGFINSEEVKSLKDLDQKTKEQIKTLSQKSQMVVAEVNQVFNELEADIFNFDSEDRVRKAGWTPQQAEDIAFILKNKTFGEIFDYKGRPLVLTPFNTVIAPQLYLTALQDRLFELTTVTVEIEISNLKKTINEFTSMSFVGLIKLAFKRLFKRG